MRSGISLSSEAKMGEGEWKDIPDAKCALRSADFAAQSLIPFVRFQGHRLGSRDVPVTAGKTSPRTILTEVPRSIVHDTQREGHLYDRMILSKFYL